jgi:hypothetical protein
VAKKLPCADSVEYNEEEVCSLAIKIEKVHSIRHDGNRAIVWDDILIDLMATNLALDSEAILSLSSQTLAKVLKRKYGELRQALGSGYIARMVHEVHGYSWEGMGKYHHFTSEEMQINHEEGARYL